MFLFSAQVFSYFYYYERRETHTRKKKYGLTPWGETKYRVLYNYWWSYYFWTYAFLREICIFIVIGFLCRASKNLMLSGIKSKYKCISGVVFSPLTFSSILLFSFNSFSTHFIQLCDALQHRSAKESVLKTFSSWIVCSFIVCICMYNPLNFLSCCCNDTRKENKFFFLHIYVKMHCHGHWPTNYFLQRYGRRQKSDNKEKNWMGERK